MLRQRRQIQTKLQKLLDAGLFGVAFWLTHAVRSLPLFDPADLIKDFETYAWLLLVIVPLAPPLLEVQGFYLRPVLGSRRLVFWQIGKAAIGLSLAVIIVLVFRKTEVSRGVILLYAPVAVAVVYGKEELVRWWLRRGTGSQPHRRRVLLVGGRLDAARLEKSLALGSFGDVEIAARLDLNEAPVEKLAELLHEHSANAVMIAPRQTLFGAIEKA
ncbi:MAG: hypothetical protein ACKOET_19480, partial [Verrucomicrobiota bacterium]